MRFARRPHHPQVIIHQAVVEVLVTGQVLVDSPQRIIAAAVIIQQRQGVVVAENPHPLAQLLANMERRLIYTEITLIFAPP